MGIFKEGKFYKKMLPIIFFYNCRTFFYYRFYFVNNNIYQLNREVVVFFMFFSKSGMRFAIQKYKGLKKFIFYKQ